MQSRNICKFVTDAAKDQLYMYQFIYEADPLVMQKKQKMTYHRIILVKKGKGKFWLDELPVAFDVGSIVFCFQNETFFVEDSDACEYMYIDFDGARAEMLFKRFHINNKNRCFPGFESLLPLWSESLLRASKENVDLASESVLLYTFSRLTPITPRQNDLLFEIVKITEERFMDPALTVSEVARLLSYNAKYISHYFKLKMQISYSEYVRNLRIKYAVSLFDNGIDSVKNVAILSGFTDPLYFSKTFKKATGVSPKMYMTR